jgi:hypothetical protein
LSFYYDDIWKIWFTFSGAKRSNRTIDELHALCSWLIKFKGMKWAGSLVCLGELRTRAQNHESCIPLIECKRRRGREENENGSRISS